MSYLVLARKYRPAGFSSVSGQDHVTRTLANAIKRDKVVHAYLFTGPRGVGKTSVARILAKALNCKRGSASEPCLTCDVCREITQGSSLAVREIDGASHNSVDNVRELMDSFKALPPPGYQYKVYIIDEVHMLSISAFNALLKSLEEPPPNTVFILATTEIHKIPETVISRCQRHDFRSLAVATIESRLREVLAQEQLEADPEAIRLIARMADGSMRDAQTLLDRVQSFCTGKLTAQDTSTALGSIERRVLGELARVIFQRDTEAVLGSVSEIFSTGSDPSTVLKEFVSFWRELFIARVAGEGALKSVGLTTDEATELVRLTGGVDPIDMQDLWDVARDGADRCMRSSQPRYAFESLVVRLATRQPVVEIAELIGRSSTTASVAKGSTIAVASTSSHSPRLEARATSAQMSKPRETATDRPRSIGMGSDDVGSDVAGSSLDWGGFLVFSTGDAGRILLENLKRIRIMKFVPGVLEGTGPDLSVSMVNKEKAKVSTLLTKYAASKGISDNSWRIQITKGPGSSDVESSGAPRAVKESKDLEEHPAIQSLQKIFPGSKVEQVRVKT